jgi:hypothetical protein
VLRLVNSDHFRTDVDIRRRSGFSLRFVGRIVRLLATLLASANHGYVWLSGRLLDNVVSQD